ncbi:translation initiation factor IF-2 [Oryctolagus cuniculus]|uniref:translation initiation factor IF-2 n=1 Tax=Oryctolagus cuniculus TaxID=9986 RepID=UPI002232A7D5|nr:translation initiation factor IF-2 [Oryctolagus cuniculus]XP_051701469.1 translation initiation factor IF-2 [Oryctolagus cuniculus]
MAPPRAKKDPFTDAGRTEALWEWPPHQLAAAEFPASQAQVGHRQTRADSGEGHPALQHGPCQDLPEASLTRPEEGPPAAGVWPSAPGPARPPTSTHLWACGARRAASPPRRRPRTRDDENGTAAGVRARPWTGLGSVRALLGAAGAAASQDWEGGWSKNVSYSSVFLPGPAPPLPPNKPFPIAQLSARQPAGPLRGCRARPPPWLLGPPAQPPLTPQGSPSPVSHIRLPERGGPWPAGGLEGAWPRAVGARAEMGPLLAAEGPGGWGGGEGGGSVTWQGRKWGLDVLAPPLGTPQCLGLLLWAPPSVHSPQPRDKQAPGG